MAIVLSVQPIKSTYTLKKILFKQAFLIKKLFESQIINKKNFKKIKELSYQMSLKTKMKMILKKKKNRVVLILSILMVPL